MEFYDGATLLGHSQVSPGDIATYSTNSLSPGTHTITANYLGDGTFGASTSNAVSAEINSNPTVNASPSSQTICSGGTFGIINFTGTATSYNWTRDNTDNLVGVDPSGPGGTTSVDGALTNITSSAQTTTFTIVGVDNNGCYSIATASVTVNPAPTLSAISGPNSVCIGPANAITLTNSTGGGSWTSSNPAIATVNGSGLVTGISSGTSVITYSITVSGCTNSVIQSISVNESPTASVTGSTTICSGQSTSIIGTASISPPITVSLPNNENTNSVGLPAG